MRKHNFILSLSKYIIDSLSKKEEWKFLYSTYVNWDPEYFEVIIKKVKRDNWSKSSVIILDDN